MLMTVSSACRYIRGHHVTPMRMTGASSFLSVVSVTVLLGDADDGFFRMHVGEACRCPRRRQRRERRRAPFFHPRLFRIETGIPSRTREGTRAPARDADDRFF